MELHFKIPLSLWTKQSFIVPQNAIHKFVTHFMPEFHAKTKGKSDINVGQNARLLLSDLCDLWLASGAQWDGMLLLPLEHMSR